MNNYSFQQGISCVIIGAVFFSAVLPSRLCLCADCHCDHKLPFGFGKTECALSINESPQGCCSQREPGCHCGDSPFKPDGNADGCCLRSKTQCHCAEFHQNFATKPDSVSPVKKLYDDSSWNMGVVSISSVGLIDTNASSLFQDARRGLLWPHVPLYMMLCVFLN